MILDKLIEITSKKSCQSQSYSDYGNMNTLLGYDYCNTHRYNNILPYIAFSYYMGVSVIYSAIGMIKDEFSNNIDPILENKQTGEQIKEFKLGVDASKILLLLENGNFESSGNELAQQITISWFVTGNIYLVVSLDAKGKPLELFNVNPQDVTITQSSNGLPYSYTINNLFWQNKVFKRKEPEYRFYTLDENYELWQIKNFNPVPNSVVGLSPTTPIYYEIDQFINSNIHNDSILKNGARPSGVLTLPLEEKYSVTDDQYKRMTNQISDFYKGSNNAGNVLVLNGQEFKELSINNKDMDFATLKTMVAKQIYTNYKIPGPLYSDESKTFNNYITAEFIFYDNTIIPYTNMLLGEIGQFLLNKYSDGSKYKLTFDKCKIPALEARQREIDFELIKSGVLTFDESRAIMNYPKLKTGGDIIYQPLNQVPVGQVQQTKFLEFAETLKKQGYSDIDIEQKWKEYQ